MNELELARKYGAVPVNQEDPALALAKKFGAKPVDHQAEYERLRASRGRPPIEQADPNLNQYFPAGHAALIGAGRTLDKIAEGNRQLGINAEIAVREAMRLPTAEQFSALNQQADTEQFKDEAYSGLRQKMPLATAGGEMVPGMVLPVGQATTAARVVLPALGMAAGGAAGYGSPEERALRGGVGLVSGLGGGVAGEVLGRMIQPVRQTVGSTAQQAAKAAADKLDAPLLPSQVAGSESLARFEDMLARSPGSAGVMRDFIDQQKAAINRRAGESVNETRPLTRDVLGDRKAELGAQYDQMRAQIPGMAAQGPVFKAIDDAEAFLTRGSIRGKDEALSMLRELKDKLYNTKQLTPDEYQGWVSDLSTAARETKNETIRTALKSVRAAMDREARGPLAKDWKELDAQYANLKTLMKPGVINEVTGDVYPGRLANTLERLQGTAGKTGKATGPLNDVADFARAVPQLRQGSQTAEREAAGSLLQWLMAPARYGAAKGMTSETMRDYLSRGLMASPEASRRFALAAQMGGVPLLAAPIDLGLLSFLSQ